MKGFKIILLIFILLIPPSLNGGDDEDFYARGLNSYLDGRMEEAAVDLRQAHSRDPSDKRARGLLGEVLVIKAGRAFEEGDNKEAFELIKEAREILPGDEKIAGVYYMLDEKLNPQEYSDETAALDEDMFGDMAKREEEKREERVKIIEMPPEKITLRERELLRPIIMASEEKQSVSAVYYILTAGFFLVIILFITGSWIKKLSLINAQTIEKISEESDERVKKMEAELKRLKEKKSREEEEMRRREERRSQKESLREERLKARYRKLLEESVSSGGKPRKVVEPVISSTEKEEEKRKELLRAFEGLKRKNVSSAVGLLKKMSLNNNPWIRLWSAELAASLDSENGRKIVAPLISDPEYAVSKAALKTVKGYLEDKRTTLKEKRFIRELLKNQREEGWVV